MSINRELREEFLEEVRVNRSKATSVDELETWLEAIKFTASNTELQISIDDVQGVFSELADALAITAGFSDDVFFEFTFQYEHIAIQRQLIKDIEQFKIDLSKGLKSKETFKLELLEIVAKHAEVLSGCLWSKPSHFFELFSVAQHLFDEDWLNQLKPETSELIDRDFLKEFESPLNWAEYLTEWDILTVNKINQ